MRCLLLWTEQRLSPREVSDLRAAILGHFAELRGNHVDDVAIVTGVSGGMVIEGDVMEEPPPPTDDDAVFQDDLRAIMRGLGLSDHARPMSPHNVVWNEVLPEISKLRQQLAAAERRCSSHGVRPLIIDLLRGAVRLPVDSLNRWVLRKHAPVALPDGSPWCRLCKREWPCPIVLRTP